MILLQHVWATWSSCHKGIAISRYFNNDGSTGKEHKGENEFSVWAVFEVKVKMKSKYYFEMNLGDC